MLPPASALGQDPERHRQRGRACSAAAAAAAAGRLPATAWPARLVVVRDLFEALVRALREDGRVVAVVRGHDPGGRIGAAVVVDVAGIVAMRAVLSPNSRREAHRPDPWPWKPPPCPREIAYCLTHAHWNQRHQLRL